MNWFVEKWDEDREQWTLAIDKKGLVNPCRSKKEALDEKRHYWRDADPLGKFRVRKYVRDSDIAVAGHGVESKPAGALGKKGKGKKEG